MMNGEIVLSVPFFFLLIPPQKNKDGTSCVCLRVACVDIFFFDDFQRRMIDGGNGM